jgi:endonuclease/exonuclease/phosphatase family metal-dependent hydrolase
MKRILLIIALIGFSFSLKSQINGDLQFGTDSTLDIVTWNIEWFPKDGNATVEYVTEIIEALDCEIYAIQEIDDTVAFNQLLDNLEGYEGTYESSYFAGLGYIYKKNEAREKNQEY